MDREGIGCPVLSADGHRIGWLTEVRGPYLRVERRLMKREGWLASEYVRSSDPGRLVMEFPADELPAFLMADPPELPEALATSEMPIGGSRW